MSVVCLGSATLDVFVILHKLQKFNYDKFSNQISFPLGDKVPLDEYEMALGGNACNVAVGLSRLGINVSLHAEIGDDEFSHKIQRALGKEGVNAGGLTHNPDRNGHFNIILSFDGERTILEEKTPDTKALRRVNTNPDLIYLTSLSGNWQNVFSQAIDDNPNSKFAMNPGPRQILEDKSVILNFIPEMEILFVNLQEAQTLMDEQTGDIKNLLEKIKTTGVKIAVITDGRNGSYSIDGENEMRQIGCVDSGKPVEGTGAGDAYATGFLYGLLQKKSVPECMKLGAINANSVIAKVGAQAGLMDHSSLDEKMNAESLEAVTI